MKRKVCKKGSFGVEYCIGAAGRLVTLLKQRTIFTEDDSGKSAFYLKDGVVKLSLTNETGKEAVIALWAPGDFLGEGCDIALKTWKKNATPRTVLKRDCRIRFVAVLTKLAYF
jgi:CRP-like cAMP-binding protein